MKTRTAFLAAAALAVALTATVASAQRGQGRGGQGAAGPGPGQMAACPYGGTRVMGQVTAVDVSAGVVSLDAAGEMVRVRIGADTLIKSGPDAIALKDVKPGQSVMACGDIDGDALDAVMLNVRFRAASAGGPGAAMGLMRGRRQGGRAGCPLGLNAGPAGRMPGRGGPGAGCVFGDQVCGQITGIDSPGLTLRVDAEGKAITVQTDGNTILKSGPRAISFGDLKTGQSICASGALGGQTLKAAMVNVRYRGR